MSYNPFQLHGKTIFISGASSGIGRATAIACSKMGAKLIITGRNIERLSSTFDALEGENHQQIVFDFANNEQLPQLIEQLPILDGVVHCAGYTQTLPFQFVNEKAITDIFQVNLFSSALLSQELVKAKKLIRNSSIVFLSSISGVYVSVLGNSMYSATKGAINGLVKGMALDLAVKGIRVNSVLPGMIRSEILNEGIVTEEQLKEDEKKYPLKRYGEPDEVAHAVIYLLSDAARWVTGSGLVIDGGYTLL